MERIEARIFMNDVSIIMNVKKVNDFVFVFFLSPEERSDYDFSNQS